MFLSRPNQCLTESFNNLSATWDRRDDNPLTLNFNCGFHGHTTTHSLVTALGSSHRPQPTSFLLTIPRYVWVDNVFTPSSRHPQAPLHPRIMSVNSQLVGSVVEIIRYPLIIRHRTLQAPCRQSTPSFSEPLLPFLNSWCIV